MCAKKPAAAAAANYGSLQIHGTAAAVAKDKICSSCIGILDMTTVAAFLFRFAQQRPGRRTTEECTKLQGPQ